MNPRTALTLIMLTLSFGVIAVGSINNFLNPSETPASAGLKIGSEAEAETESETEDLADEPFADHGKGVKADDWPVLPPLTDTRRWQEAEPFEILYAVARDNCATGPFTLFAGPITQDSGEEWQVVSATETGLRIQVLPDREQGIEFTLRETALAESANDAMYSCLCHPGQSGMKLPPQVACVQNPL